MICSVPRSVQKSVRWLSDFSKEQVLNSENVKKTMSKFKAMPVIRMHTIEPKRRAAVLIPLCIVDNNVCLLYTLRASQMRSHKGQVSFPGGMQDVHDRSLEVTALRETKEELGITQDKITVWGTGNIIVPRSDLSVLPVVGMINGNVDVGELDINKAEVEEAFAVPLPALCRPENLGYTQFRSGYSTPVYLGGSKRIWGLTAIITNAFLRCLLPVNMYAHKVRYLMPVKTSTGRSQIKK